MRTIYFDAMKGMRGPSMFLLILGMTVFSSCQPEIIIPDCPWPCDGPQRAMLSVDKMEIAASAAADTYQLQVTATQAWQAEVDAEAAAWCAISPDGYAGNHAVEVHVAENPTTEIRTATILFTAGMLTRTVVVTQAAAAPLLIVAPVIIDATAGEASYPIAVTSNTDWTARVDGDAAWCTLSGATGKGSGTVIVNTAFNVATETRSTTVTITADTLVRVVSVMQGEWYAASGETWAFGNQTWSDAIRMPLCNKDTFSHSYTEADCRSFAFEGKLFYYYNWLYVSQNGERMCPTPWRVPTQADFSDLITNLGGNTQSARNTIRAAWGNGGHADGRGSELMSQFAYYWSATELSGVGTYAHILQYNDYEVSAGYSSAKELGFQVRCVRD
jgi:uncharacterized protein (TIGR02145 family)